MSIGDERILEYLNENESGTPRKGGLSSESSSEIHRHRYLLITGGVSMLSRKFGDICTYSSTDSSRPTQSGESCDTRDPQPVFRNVAMSDINSTAFVSEQ
jgi:hypothetical protein